MQRHHGCPEDIEQLVPPGFEAEGHEITLYGQCRHCSADSGVVSLPNKPELSAPHPKRRISHETITLSSND